jgi:hypothetical protein
MKDINKMTVKDFRKLKCKGWREDIGKFNSLIILPGYSKDIHDSGYRCMDFIAVKGSKPICRLSGCSDVIHVDGIGGYGYKWSEKGQGVPLNVEAKGWSVDCLPKSGLLRFFADGDLVVDPALSSFSVYCIKRKK